MTARGKALTSSRLSTPSSGGSTGSADEMAGSCSPSPSWRQELPAGSAPDGLTWTANGPDGGGATYIEIDPRTPSTLYAGTTMAGVFRARTVKPDVGAPCSNGLPANAGVGPFELAPSDPSRLYAAVGGNTLFTTTDAGDSWRPLARLENYIDRLVVDPSQPRTIYGTSDRA